jgi:hypothetical protein|tara:strand:+ start:1460 stop:1813 length:354 start_codon:yes stop_codon:yes gene_type:complete
MANKNKYTEAQIKDALTKAGGFISIACKSLNCTRRTIYNYIDKFPELKDIVKDIREQYLDIAEAALIKNVKDGKSSDIKYFLNTQGKKRGYIEKSELDITSGDEPIKININIKGVDY